MKLQSKKRFVTSSPRTPRWKLLAILGTVVVIVGIVITLVTLVLLEEQPNGNNRRRSIKSVNGDGSEDVTKTIDKKLVSTKSYKPHKHYHKPKRHDIEMLFGIREHQLKNQSQWHKVKTNAMHEGNKLESYVHLMMVNNDIALNGKYGSKQLGLNLDCLPPYTLGVNLSVPGSGYSIDIDSISRLNQIYAVNVIDGATDRWNQLGTVQVFGNRVGWDGVPDNPNDVDGKNQITFGSIEPGSVLAYTRVFGYFGGFPISMRRIIEWDIVFGDASNSLCDAGSDSGCYHFPAVTFHELGHALGLGDVYTSGCKPYTIMFGSRSQGQTFPTLPQELDVVVHAYLYPRISYYALTNGTDLDGPGGGTSSILSVDFWALIFLIVGIL